MTVFELLGYRIVKDTDRRFYMVNEATGGRSSIGTGPRDEQWLMGGDWMTDEQLLNLQLPKEQARCSQ